MYKLRVVQSGKQYDYEPGASLLEILLAQNIFIDNPCNGKGICGKCKVKILSTHRIRRSRGSIFYRITFLKTRRSKKWCASFLYGSSTV